MDNFFYVLFMMFLTVLVILTLWWLNRLIFGKPVKLAYRVISNKGPKTQWFSMTPIIGNGFILFYDNRDKKLLMNKNETYEVETRALVETYMENGRIIVKPISIGELNELSSELHK